MFSQNDSELMTPLDIIINRQDENSLKIVMNSINDLCKKFLNENNNNSLLEKSFKYENLLNMLFLNLKLILLNLNLILHIYKKYQVNA